MSYLVFARKWRPLSFDDVVGQEHVTVTLKKAIEKQRVAHAYIFSGTRGVGKTTTARILARALNCENGPTPEPCGTCDSCKAIISGSSFDVLEIDGASNNKVDDIRELRDNIGYTPMGGRYRVFVIDEVHMLTPQAFNALLKTLEEPPPSVIFIFATTEPHKIPETIHSRCQRYDFRRISTEQILQRLEKICTEEGIPFDRAGLMPVARKADGSMRDGLSLLDQVHSYCQETIGEKEVRSVLGLVDADVYQGIVDAVLNRDPAGVLGALEEVLTRGFDLHEFLTGLVEHLRNLLFARIPGVFENPRSGLNAENAELCKEQAARLSEGTLLRMTEILRRTEHDLKWSSFPRFLVEVALLKLVFLDDSVAVEDILRGLKQAQGAPPASAPAHSEAQKKKDVARPADSSQAVMEAEEVHAASSADTPTEDESFEDRAADQAPPVDLAKAWPEFLDVLLRDSPNLGSFLSSANVVSTTEQTVELRFPPSFKFQFTSVTSKEHRALITRKLHEFAGREVELHITLEQKNKESEGRTPQTNPDTVSRVIDDDIRQEPIIAGVLEEFDGEVVQ